MSSKVAVIVNNVSKVYHMYDRPQDRLKQLLWRGRKNFYHEFWALKDISFEVNQGETIGIIGRNGSGKSTLLQLITGTLTPSIGDISIKGRVAALLELGSGFNPEFTGRENVFMNGAIMGLSPSEIEERMPLIESFAEIGEFIDQPVKIYSSGMFVRLAFACAVNVNPDILVIDEALAVGDTQFQLKCIAKMKSFKKEGKTILFVSHDVYSVRNFCDKAIWMMDGHIHVSGDVYTVVEQYENFMNKGVAPVDEQKTEEQQASVNEKKKILTIDDACFVDNQGNKTKSFPFGQDFSVEVDFTIHSLMEGIVGGIAIYDKQNTYVCGLNTKLDKKPLPSQPGKYKFKLSYVDMALLPGIYYIDIGFFESSALVQLDFKTRAKSFRISSGEYFAEGVTYIKHEWHCERVD